MLETHDLFEGVFLRNRDTRIPFTGMVKDLNNLIVKAGLADSVKLRVAGKNKYTMEVKQGEQSYTWLYDTNDFLIQLV